MDDGRFLVDFDAHRYGVQVLITRWTEVDCIYDDLTSAVERCMALFYEHGHPVRIVEGAIIGFPTVVWELYDTSELYQPEFEVTEESHRWALEGF